MKKLQNICLEETIAQVPKNPKKTDGDVFLHRMLYFGGFY